MSLYNKGFLNGREVEIVRIRRKSIGELHEEYRELRREALAFWDAFKRIPEDDVDTRRKVAIEGIKRFAKMKVPEIQIIERFSPRVAKRLASRIRAMKRNTLEWLSKDYPNHSAFSEDMITDLKKSTLNLTVDNLGALIGIGDEVFLACLDTIERTGGKLPKEIDERISELLIKHFPKHAKHYKGAWDALESDNPERFRHSSTSTRELIKRILGKGSEERKRMLESIHIPDTEAELIEALADTVYLIDRVLNKGVHSEVTEPTALLSIRASELILNYILDKLEEAS